MHNLFRQGAFQGRSPREAYFVKCDSETTTQNDIDRGVVNILVGFAPLKPSEFVTIKMESAMNCLVSPQVGKPPFPPVPITVSNIVVSGQLLGTKRGLLMIRGDTSTNLETLAIPQIGLTLYDRICAKSGTALRIW